MRPRTAILLIGLALTACRGESNAVLEPAPAEGEGDLRVEASPGRGIYPEAQQVALVLAGEAPADDATSNDGSSAADQGPLEIRFTLDGSAPRSDHGSVYVDPIEIDANTVLRTAAFRNGIMRSGVSTHSFLFPEATLGQPSSPGASRGFPPNWGSFEGETVAADYGMDPRAFEAEGSREDALASLVDLPSVSLALEPAALFDADSGIYANPTERGRDWERTVSVELIDPGGFTEEFQVDAGLRVHGYYSRLPSKSAKHSLRLHFRKDYGPGKLEASLFPESAIDRFDSLVLRAMVNDSFLMNGEKAQYLRDAWLRETERRMGLRTAHGRYVHLYLSGMYWGLYELTERLDEEFAADYWGGEPEDYDIVLHAGANAGDLQAWEETLALAEAGVKSREAYEALAEKVDLVAFADHWILGQFAARTDWPSANWTAVRRRAPEGRWRFPGWDAEASLLEIDLDRSGSAEDGTPAQLYSRLRRSPEFQRMFGDRVHRHLFGAYGSGRSMRAGLLYADPNLSAWGVDVEDARSPAAARYAALAQGIEDAVVLEAARWGDWERPDVRNRDRGRDWIPARDFVLGTFMRERRLVVLEQFRARGLYPEVAAPEFRFDSGGVTPIDRSEGGRIYCRGDGGDPRIAWNGAPAPEAQVLEAGRAFHEGPVSLSCRTRTEDGWSALVAYRWGEAHLRVSELMYHPAEDGDAEFIELANPQDVRLNIGGYQLDGGIEFRFPEPTWIEPAQRIVLVSDPKAFQKVHPAVDVAGRFVGRLSNKGETIRLFNGEGRLIEMITYADTAPWPESADGAGASLERAVDWSAAGIDASDAWRTSEETGGSPGR